MNFLLLILAFAGIAACDLPGMIKEKQWNSLAVYCIVFLLVLTLGLCIAAGVKVPSPIKAVQAFYRDVLGLSFKLS